MPNSKPASGSYGLVVVLGYVFLVAACALTAVCALGLFSAIRQMGAYGGSVRLVATMACLTAGLPCLGLSGIFLLRRLAPIDAAAVHLAWRRGALYGQLPAAPGSSLPYILPLTAGGGLLAILPILLVADEDSMNSWYWSGMVFPMLVIGALVGLLGLALGEVRRFLWRMECVAKALANHQAAGPSMPSRTPAHYGAAWTAMLAAACVALLTMLASLADMGHRIDRQSFSMWLAGCLAYPGGLLSLAFVTSAAAQTLGAWNRALGTPGLYTRPRPGGLDAAPAMSRVFLFFASAWGCVLVIATFHAMARWGFRLDDDFVLAMSMAGAAALAAFWCAAVFAGVFRARVLVEDRMGRSSAMLTYLSVQGGLARHLKWALLACSVTIVACLLPEFRGSDWFMMMLVLSGLAFAAVWLGFLADEMRLLAEFLDAFSKADPPPERSPAALSEVPPGAPYA